MRSCAKGTKKLFEWWNYTENKPIIATLGVHESRINGACFEILRWDAAIAGLNLATEAWRREYRTRVQHFYSTFELRWKSYTKLYPVAQKYALRYNITRILAQPLVAYALQLNEFECQLNFSGNFFRTKTRKLLFRFALNKTRIAVMAFRVCQENLHIASPRNPRFEES